ncbi:hypothetical protein [Streptococcus sp. S784/96/1]|uniref:hypothetical protein n=1 Tax=Streptococcus sp. S784/96/1 TaxID=2653499 RepID=UPI00138A2D66|nr:hypothetical protein [Streptococcus sp. S784/96/1]
MSEFEKRPLIPTEDKLNTSNNNTENKIKYCQEFLFILNRKVFNPLNDLSSKYIIAAMVGLKPEKICITLPMDEVKGI